MPFINCVAKVAKDAAAALAKVEVSFPWEIIIQPTHSFFIKQTTRTRTRRARWF
jgi:hypothetical protein